MQDKWSEITVPDKVKVNGKSFKVTAIAKNAFKGNESLEKVILGKYVTIIGKNAFAGLSNLAEIYFKVKKITKVYSGAFNGISRSAEFFMKGNKTVRKDAASKIKKSGYGKVSITKF